MDVANYVRQLRFGYGDSYPNGVELLDPEPVRYLEAEEAAPDERVVFTAPSQNWSLRHSTCDAKAVL